MGDEKHGDAGAEMKRLQLIEEVASQGLIQRREGFVEKQKLRAGGERSGQRDPLLFSSGEVPRRAILKSLEPHPIEDFPYPRAALRPRQTDQAEAHIALDTQVREEDVLLEEDPQFPGSGRDLDPSGSIRKDRSVEDDSTGVGPGQPRDAAESQTLPCAGGTEEGGDPGGSLKPGPQMKAPHLEADVEVEH
jgi:hypothetical protein